MQKNYEREERININFEIIDCLLVIYGKFNMEILIKLLLGSESKAKKISSLYNKAYQEKFEDKAYKVITVGHYVYNTGERYLEKSVSFRPLTKVASTPVATFEHLLRRHAALNLITLDELIDRDNTLSLVNVSQRGELKSHHTEFSLIDLLFTTCGELDLFELQELLDIETISRARYLMDIYAQHADIVFSKTEGLYKASPTWKTAVLSNENHQYAVTEFLF